MKLPTASLALAATLPFIAHKLTSRTGATDCKLSNLICGEKPTRETCRNTAKACMNDMRQAANGFTQLTDSALQQLEPHFSEQESDLLQKVDFLYQCRSNEFDLTRRLERSESLDTDERFENQREIGSNDSEIGFAHERYLYPLVSNFPASERSSLGDEIMKQSAKLKESHHVFKAATDCLAKYSGNTR